MDAEGSSKTETMDQQTRRDYFIGQALQGLLANDFYAKTMPFPADIPTNVARRAIEIADELMKQLSTPKDYSESL